ncbi:MAG: ATP-binding protein [Phycisphaerae bacterium]
MHNNKSIRVKILMVFGVTLIAASVMNIIFISQILIKDYKSALHNELLITAGSIQSQIQKIASLGIAVKNIDGFGRQCNEIINKNNRISQAMVLDSEGTIIFHSNPAMHGLKLQHDEIIPVIKRGQTKVLTLGNKNERMYFAVMPFSGTQGTGNDAVAISSYSNIINDKIFSLINKANSVLLCSFGFAGLFLLYCMKIVLTKPLTAISNTMKEITETGNLDRTIDIKNRDEIGAIAFAFNHMIIELKNKTTSIENLNNEIKERKKVEEKLMKLLSLHTATLESTADGILVVNLNGRVVGYNRKFLELWNVPQELAETKDDNMLLSFVLNQLEDAEGFMTEVRRLYCNQQESCHDYLTFKDGRLFERISQPQKVGETIIGRVWCFRDITEQNRAQEKVKRSQQILYDMIDAMPFGVMLVGKDKRIRMINDTARQLTGYSKNDLLGCLCHETLCTCTENNCPIIDHNKTFDRSEQKLITKDKRELPILKSVVALNVGDEDVLLEAFIDISDRKEAERKLYNLNSQLEIMIEKLQKTNEDIKRLVYITSHDLREPSRKVMAFGEILKGSLADRLTPDERENLNFMVEGARHMSNMLEGLLAYSRINTRGQPSETVDLNEIVQQINYYELSAIIEETNAVIDVPQKLDLVKVDEIQIRTLLSHLITNGIKFRQKDINPHITITSRPSVNGMTMVEVSDNGIGIAPEYHQTIFEMFRRLHSREDYEGTGVGLALCKKIVERYGGQIGVESQQGKGSTFWFTVPPAKETAKTKV